MENSKIAALVELGILCRGEPVEVSGDGAADHGPHAVSGHNQLCRFEHPQFQHPFEDPSLEAYAFFSADTPVQEALGRTRLVIVLGAADTPQLRACLESPNAVVVLFEPDERVLIGFLEAVGLARLNRKNFFCFTGDPYSFNPALQDLFPGDVFKRGTPLFLLTDRIDADYGPWAARVIDYFEVLHYRHVIYPLSGQGLTRSRPIRNIFRGLVYDQQRHAYQNIPDYLACPPIAELRNRLHGLPAILVAAGPDLPDKFEYIRANRDRAVVICVNNAVKPLVDAGIRPHFVIINDTSVDSGVVFRHIPELPETILVAHCLSELGDGRFRQKYLFGNFLPEIFGSREMLRLHGSVISTAFSLATLLGCPKCVLVGAQLASDNPWGLRYAEGTVKKSLESGEKPLIQRHPQLYPVTTPFGEQRYTTINFRDAALWLAEVIRLSGVECVNTSKSSILYGEGIEYDGEPELPEASVVQPFSRLFRAAPPNPDRKGVRRYVAHELGLWKSVSGAVRAMLDDDGPAMAAKGMAILKQLDGSNVTYMVERRKPFNNQKFYKLVFQGSEADRRAGLVHYFENVLDMSEEFLALLNTAARSV
ncbi:6-hydroxymethylpterin diphosphokinase MptE-like protein [Pseudodesulfovibrio portus]|uniref:6-hydroxymethylpterin diphosphokinase MptE-like domain-containing protein n=1 Tax=Pseudodesulfovibrio portus TaxID=231439 RepID=A0ABM8AT82_9BACT|nr:6-hydroxymethylpterin diphosphokinase MptE-like protein [Pseudodesulfovibrio portus]BDQ34687.1 hypothetical protein JCM14722_22290 [Pseudodesulfovibrio portus]